MTGDIRVNVPELRTGALSFREAAGGLPDAPAPFTSSGGDDLSVALTNGTNEKEAPLVEAMPRTRADAQGTAANIGVAADRYEQTDQEAHDKVQARIADFDSTFGAPGSAGGGGAMDAMSQFGQLMQMPMQMAQQLGQMPMQMAQQLGQIPQAVMQGVEQIGQMAGGLGESGGAEPNNEGQQPEPGQEDARDEREEDEREKDEQQSASVEGAAAEQSGSERAPAAAPPTGGVPDSSPSGSVPNAAPPAPDRTPSDPSIVL